MLLSQTQSPAFGLLEFPFPPVLTKKGWAPYGSLNGVQGWVVVALHCTLLLAKNAVKIPDKTVPRLLRYILPLISLHRFQFSTDPQVALARLHPLRPLQQLPSHEEARKDGDHHVAEQEGGHVPFPRQEDRVPAHEDHDEAARQRVGRRVRLEPGGVGQGGTIDRLGDASTAEGEERVGHDAEVDEL